MSIIYMIHYILYYLFDTKEKKILSSLVCMQNKYGSFDSVKLYFVIYNLCKFITSIFKLFDFKP